MADILHILTAFSAGLLSFFSPCILPLIPAYLSFITGLSTEELKTSGEKEPEKTRSILPESLLFILGFSIVFIILGASATFLGSFLFAKERIIKIIGGLIVVFFGLHISGLVNIKFLQYEKKFRLRSKPLTKIGSFLLGVVFGFGWTPCVGPILGSILMLAATKESIVKGVVLLSSYSFGLGLPFFLLSIGLQHMLGLFSKAKRYFKPISAASGILLIIIGIGIVVSAF